MRPDLIYFSRLDLHRIRAHLLHYTSLLDDFRKSVLFVLNNPNPAMDCQDAPDDGTTDMLTKEESAERLKTECNNLLSEIGIHLASCRDSSHMIVVVVRETRDVKKYPEQAFEEHYEFSRHFWVGWFSWMSGCSRTYAGFQHCQHRG